MPLSSPPLADPPVPILHPDLPLKVWMDPRLARMPGVVPLDREGWLRPDAAYGPQMAERARLIGADLAAVHACLPQARAAADELYAMIAARLPVLGFSHAGDAWLCPDGRVVAVDRDNPLVTLGLLVQDDLCLMQPGPEGDSVLTAAILCFPAGWTLAEKLGRAMLRIHLPVGRYDADLARRVQRLLDAVRPETPLMRGNAHPHAEAKLHDVRSETDPRDAHGPFAYLRAERQALLRLPLTGAVVFTIRTYLVAREVLTAAEEAAFFAWRAATYGA